MINLTSNPQVFLQYLPFLSSHPSEYSLLLNSNDLALTISKCILDLAHGQMYEGLSEDKIHYSEVIVYLDELANRCNIYIYIYIYIERERERVWFYCISTIVGHLMPNPLYIYIIIYMISKHPIKWFHLFLSNTNKSIDYNLFICSQLDIFKYCYSTYKWN